MLRLVALLFLFPGVFIYLANANGVTLPVCVARGMPCLTVPQSLRCCGGDICKKSKMAQTCQAPCGGDNTWTLSSNNPQLCYKAFAMPNGTSRSYNDGQQLCTTMNAKIAPMRNENERLAIKTATDKLDRSFLPSSWQNFTYLAVYFGLRDISTSCSNAAQYQVTYDGSIIQPSGYTNWYTNEPARCISPFGVLFQCTSAMLNQDYKWNDIFCDDTAGNVMIGVVCAKEA